MAAKKTPPTPPTPSQKSAAPPAGKKPPPAAAASRPRRARPPQPPPMLDAEMIDPTATADMMGMADPEEILAAWLEGQVMPKEVQDMEIELRQKLREGEQTVHTWSTEELDGQSPSSIAAMIRGQADSDIEGQIGITRYVVNACYSNGKVFSRCYFRLEPQDPGVSGADSELAHTEGGFLQQAHRHTEFAIRTLAIQTAEVMRQQRDANKAYGALSQQLFDTRVKAVETFEAMMDRKQERQLKYEAFKRNEGFKTMAISKVMEFAPELARRLGLMSEDQRMAMQDTEGFMAWLMTITPEVAQQMMANITDQKQKQAFERAYTRAMSNRARLALHGGTPSSMTTTVPGTPAPAQGQSAKPWYMTIEGEEKAVFLKAVMALFILIVEMEDPIFGMLKGQIPLDAAGREWLAAMRAEVRKYTPANPMPHEKVQPLLMTFEGHIATLLVAVPDAQFMMLLSQVKPEDGEAIKAARALARAKTTSAAA